MAGTIQSTELNNSFATGNVSGTKKVGGLVGNTYCPGNDPAYSSQINYCFAAGEVVGTDPSTNGGLLGERQSFETVTNSYYNTETCGQTDNSGKGIPKTTVEMKQQSTYESWDFDDIWTIQPNETYPGLQLLNNVPFAFRSSLEVAAVTSLSSVLENDYDIETLQEQLVLKVEKLYGIGSTDSLNWYMFPPGTPLGTTDSLSYRVGELLDNGDILWGNRANVVLTKIASVPEITSVPMTIVLTGQLYTYTVNASDFDHSPLSYELTNEPAGMTITDSVITWTAPDGPTTTDLVTLVVSNGTNSVTQEFAITVKKENHPPEILSSAPTLATVGSLYIYTVDATDPDDDSLTYLLTNAPEGMSISDNIINWTPSEGTTTSGEITLTVSDGALTDIEEFTITVKPENNAPVINSTASTSATVGSQYTYSVDATDPDGDSLIYSLANAPEGMSISENVINWTPPEGITTSGEITLTVTDGALSDTEVFTITVSPVTVSVDENICHWKVYPNPAPSQMFIEYIGLTLNRADIQIIGIDGKIYTNMQLNRINTNTLSVDLSMLSTGIYYCRLVYNETTETIKLIKQ